MLVLTAFTAVHRFVRVWRQATPERAPRGRHPRPAEGAPAQDGGLVRRFTARRPGQISRPSRAASRRSRP
jgi:hypothetical protein